MLMNKIKIFLIVFLVYGIIGCFDEKDDKNSSYAKIVIQVDGQSINAYEHEDTRGIKLYPDFEYWHVNFKYQGNQLENSIIFQLKKNLIEGEELRLNDNAVQITFQADDGTYKSSQYKDDFILTVEKWNDSGVELSFSGKVWDGGIKNKTLNGTITTVIDENNNPAYFSSFDNFDDYNQDGKILIDMTSINKVTFVGKCNSSYGSPASKEYTLNVPKGNYNYKFNVFNLAQGSSAKLINTGTSNTIETIHNKNYIDVVSEITTRIVKIQQGNYWNTSGNYELVIEKN